MQKEARHSTLLTIGIWVTGVATAGFMLADFFVRPTQTWLTLVPVYCLAAFALLHSFTFMNMRQAIWFLVLGLILPFVAEWLGTNFGAIFGSHYFARARDIGIETGIRLPGRVSLAMVLSWYAMLYLTFITSIHLLHARRTDASAFAAVPLTAGLLMAFWQLSAGPVAIFRGAARFAQDGFYHGIPLSSFVGWFATSVFILLFFQALEPSTVDSDQLTLTRRNARVGYGTLGMAFLYPALLCFRFGMASAAWLGMTIVLFYILVHAIRARTPRTLASLDAVAGSAA